jgi:hypothetical protein
LARLFRALNSLNFPAVSQWAQINFYTQKMPPHPGEWRLDKA